MRKWQWAIVAVGAIGAGVAAGRGTREPAPPRTPRGPLVALTAPAASMPRLDEVHKVAPISVKTKGKPPMEAFEMLGKAVGVRFEAVQNLGRGGGTTAQRAVLAGLYEDRVKFDLENVGFWEGAMRLGDAARVCPNGDGDVMTLRPLLTDMTKDLQVQDTAAMRVMLYKENYYNVVFEFLLDPRLAVLKTGDLRIERAIDDAGKQLEGQIVAVQFPCAPTMGRGVHGILSLTAGVDFPPPAGPAEPKMLEVIRGYLPVVVATKTQALEYAIVGGKIADMEAHRVGDWSIRATGSKLLPPRVSSGPEADYETKLVVERLTEAAPPFPTESGLPMSQSAAEAIGHFEGSPRVSRPLSGVTSADGKSQEWTVRLNVGGNENPATKLIIDVPIEAKAVVLPFEFKKVPLGR